MPQPPAASASSPPGIYAMPANPMMLNQWIELLRTESRHLTYMINAHFSHIHDVLCYMAIPIDTLDSLERLPPL